MGNIWDVTLPIDEFIVFQDGHIAPPISWFQGLLWPVVSLLVLSRE